MFQKKFGFLYEVEWKKYFYIFSEMGRCLSKKEQKKLVVVSL